MVSIKKSVLRKEAMKARRKLEVHPDWADQARDLFFESFAPTKKDIVSVYWTANHEFDTWPIIEELIKRDIPCALPVTTKGRRLMQFVLWHDGVEMVEKLKGIMEPVVDDSTEFVEPNIILAPLLAFDRKGYRLGYGGGNYDRTLIELREKKDIKVIGLAYAQQACLFNLPREEHDIPCDWIVTQQGVIKIEK